MTKMKKQLDNDFANPPEILHDPFIPVNIL